MAKITHVALRFQGKTYSLPAPNRHHDVIQHIIDETGVDTVNTIGEDQGFLDADGKYWTRRQAFMIAQKEGQIKEGSTGLRLKRLYSEDVW